MKKISLKTVILFIAVSFGISGCSPDEIVVMQANLETRLINESPWKITSWVQDGHDIFNEQELGNGACYPTGVYNKQKALSANYTFSKGSAKVDLVWENQRWDCNTNGYFTYSENDSFTHNWKIDPAGRFIVSMNNTDIAWLNVQENGNQVSMSGKFIMSNGEETIWSMKFEKQ